MKVPPAAPKADHAWRNRAACRDEDPELWFSYDSGLQKIAEKICIECPVMRECRAFGIKSGQEYGMWGGLDEKVIRAVQRKMKREQQAV